MRNTAGMHDVADGMFGWISDPSLCRNVLYLWVVFWLYVHRVCVRIYVIQRDVRSIGVSRLGRLWGNLCGRHVQWLYLIGSNMSYNVQRVRHYCHLRQWRYMVGNGTVIQWVYIKRWQFLYGMQRIMRPVFKIMHRFVYEWNRLFGYADAFGMPVNVWIVFGDNVLFL